MPIRAALAGKKAINAPRENGDEVSLGDVIHAFLTEILVHEHFTRYRTRPSINERWGYSMLADDLSFKACDQIQRVLQGWAKSSNYDPDIDARMARGYSAAILKFQRQMKREGRI